MDPFIVGIAGGTGSGKTTIVKQLVERLGPGSVVVIEHDSYYSPDPHLSFKDRQRINYDHPDSLETSLLVNHLRSLRTSQAVDIPSYDCTRHVRRKEARRVVPKPVIIVEGILALAEKALRDCFDLCIFVSTDSDIRLIRRLQRDRVERGRSTASVILQYLSTVKPMHDRYVKPSQHYADLIVQGNRQIERAVDVLAVRLKAILSGSKTAVTLTDRS